MGTIDNVLNGMNNIIKKNWVVRLFDSQDTSVSATTVFLTIITIIGFLLLVIPAVILLIEVYYNHTITTDLNGMAAYISSVVALFATGGLTKAWTNWAQTKYKATHRTDTNSSDDVDIE